MLPPNDVEQGDCIRLMAMYKEGCADLVFADPPFNIGYKYDVYDDDREREEYLKWAARWLFWAERLLSPGGAFWLAIGDEYAAEYKKLLDQRGLEMRNWCIWNYNFGPHQKKKFGRDHAHLLYYVKPGAPFVFNDDLILVPSLRQTKYNDKRAKAGGRVPGDVWHIPRLPGNAKERTGHPCQMPESILERIILACSDPTDRVIDPFAGSGTTLAVAKRLGRDYWGCDISQQYVEKVWHRLDAVRYAA